MKNDPVQTIIKQDALPLSVGGATIFGMNLADLSTIFQQIGVILGTLLVAVTLLHRIYMFWKDVHK